MQGNVVNEFSGILLLFFSPLHSAWEGIKRRLFLCHASLRLTSCEIQRKGDENVCREKGEHSPKKAVSQINCQQLPSSGIRSRNCVYFCRWRDNVKEPVGDYSNNLLVVAR